ncbi:universal stress protein [Halobacterium yunchengense]|uniref:universal stress protein n=1 Tax=Halobacterium yunchengense TaxID=3108497 RepID=UPI00300A7E75
MTYVVAFDNSPLARAALSRAVTFARASDQTVVAVTAIPKDSSLARQRGWLGGNETFSVETVADNLAGVVADFGPDVRFEYQTVDRYAPRGRVSRAIRDVAVRNDAEVVFIGSDNAGRMIGGITSVGQNVSADDRYDVHIVRHADAE